jgi:hypothetical protein
MQIVYGIILFKGKNGIIRIFQNSFIYTEQELIYPKT